MTVFRRVTSKDKEFLFDLANEKTVRSNSFHNHEISWEEHEEWFQKKQADKNSEMLLLCLDDTPIGQCRLELEGDRAVVNYSVLANYRGKGYGCDMLVRAEKLLQQEYKRIHFLCGYVMLENIASQKCFEKLGYQKEIEEDSKIYYSKKV